MKSETVPDTSEIQLNIEKLSDKSLLNNNANPDTSTKTASISLEQLNPFQKNLYKNIKQFLWVPALISSILQFLICIIPYLITTGLGYLQPIFPFVSDTGSFLPVANYFSQMIDIQCILVGLSLWARYKQSKHYISTLLPEYLSNSKEYSLHKDRILCKLQRLNFNSFLLLIPSTTGGILIGNFRSVENMTIHLIGVSLLFFSVAFYTFAQISIMAELSRIGDIETPPTSLRIVSVLYCIGLIMTCICASIASLLQGGFTKYWDNDLRLNWSKGMPGFEWHVSGTAFEWFTILMISPIFYILSRRLRLFKQWHLIKF